MRKLSSLVVLPAVVVAGLIVLGGRAESAQAADCVAPANPVVCENSLPGSPPERVGRRRRRRSRRSRASRPTSASTTGETVQFKIDDRRDATTASTSTGSAGTAATAPARSRRSTPSAALPQAQPACLTSAATGLVDCGNWAESASWAVPADAVSGVYIARLAREDDGRRQPHRLRRPRRRRAAPTCSSRPSDTTWQAYNRYGGNSLYGGAPAGRAYKVSYNRPFTTRAATRTVELPLQRRVPDDPLARAQRLRRQLHDRRRHDRRGAELLEHRGLPLGRPRRVLVGGPARERRGARATPASTSRSSAATRSTGRRAGSRAIDGSGTPHRTLVSLQGDARRTRRSTRSRRWTGTWRDPRFSPPADGGRPENALTGRSSPSTATATTRSACPADVRQAAPLAQHERRRRSGRRQTATLRAPARSATSGTRTSTTASGPAGWSACRRRR